MKKFLLVAAISIAAILSVSGSAEGFANATCGDSGAGWGTADGLTHNYPGYQAAYTWHCGYHKTLHIQIQYSIYFPPSNWQNLEVHEVTCNIVGGCFGSTSETFIGLSCYNTNSYRERVVWSDGEDVTAGWKGFC